MITTTASAERATWNMYRNAWRKARILCHGLSGSLAGTRDCFDNPMHRMAGTNVSASCNYHPPMACISDGRKGKEL